MTRDEAIAKIQERLSFRTDKFDEIAGRLRDTQTLLEQGRTLPWFLLVEDYPLLVAAAGISAALPSNFIREKETTQGQGLYYLESGSTVPIYLRKLPKDEVSGFTSSSSLTFPKSYRIKGNTIVLSPPPSAATTFYLDYYAHDTVLSSDVENEWLRHAPYLLMGNAGMSIARTLQHNSAVAEFQAMAASASDALFKENIAREINNRSFVLGRRA